MYPEALPNQSLQKISEPKTEGFMSEGVYCIILPIEHQGWTERE
jgi:hypothetical protein